MVQTGGTYEVGCEHAVVCITKQRQENNFWYEHVPKDGQLGDGLSHDLLTDEAVRRVRNNQIIIGTESGIEPGQELITGSRIRGVLLKTQGCAMEWSPRAQIPVGHSSIASRQQANARS